MNAHYYCLWNRNTINRIDRHPQIIGTAKVTWLNGMNRITIVQPESIHINVEVVRLNVKCLIMRIEMVHGTKKNGMTVIHVVDVTPGKQISRQFSHNTIFIGNLFLGGLIVDTVIQLALSRMP